MHLNVCLAHNLKMMEILIHFSGGQSHYIIKTAVDFFDTGKPEPILNTIGACFVKWFVMLDVKQNFLNTIFSEMHFAPVEKYFFFFG